MFSASAPLPAKETVGAKEQGFAVSLVVNAKEIATTCQWQRTRKMWKYLEVSNYNTTVGTPTINYKT